MCASIPVSVIPGNIIHLPQSVEYTGMEISMGGSGYRNVYGQINEAQSLDSVHYAIDKGINYIDTAYWYHKSSNCSAKKNNSEPR